jgi:hypothetical protein
MSKTGRRNRARLGPGQVQCIDVEKVFAQAQEGRAVGSKAEKSAARNTLADRNVAAGDGIAMMIGEADTGGRLSRVQSILVRQLLSCSLEAGTAHRSCRRKWKAL